MTDIRPEGPQTELDQTESPQTESRQGSGAPTGNVQTRDTRTGDTRAPVTEVPPARPPERPTPELGVRITPEGTRFRAWSSHAQQISLATSSGAIGSPVTGSPMTGSPATGSGTDDQIHPMTPQGRGVWETTINAPAGTRYHFLLDGVPTPDPYARYMPGGLHADAEVVDPFSYRWRDERWMGLPLHECVFYELHVGTFTPEGTYRAAAERLPYLRELGVTAIELMPLSAFPGTRGWGYDGAALFAPHAAYGTPDDLKALVDAAHGLGLGVFLDVVYNHFGPDGAYLSSYSRDYFTDRFQSPWGDGLDYREGHMRRLIVENARMWLAEYHLDGLRLDATQAMQDDSRKHILHELAERVHEVGAELGQRHLLLAEDYRNLPLLVSEYCLDGIWVDDFHHSVRVALTDETDGYYGPFARGAGALARAINRGWVYEGQNWPLENRPRGAPADALDAPSFVYFIQNHDQIGNRALGDRLNMHERVSPQAFRAASTLLLTLPMTPLLFQGQEWAASTPFQFFTDHHGELGALVSEGRKREFGDFESFGGHVPDPQDERTFLDSKLNWEEREQGEHARTLQLYRQLLALRRSDAVLRDPRRDTLSAGSAGEVLWVRRRDRHGERVLLWNLGAPVVLGELQLPFALPPSLLLHSEGLSAADMSAADMLQTQHAALLGRNSP